ncbi:citrate lyase subunit beta/citryl-CoA lyase [Neorhizobium huautlense]|uniref:Citrate lyase subunit beta/citryl-CoA lyase n=1 Tax=Neorhizobium huautlense TaxID=67774 RepID=A0ABT9PYC4_9HYPH|nr:aldolase/citrate lyase family protein [Neorhizobium huautlense]MDP9839486.1 citrate lyase subunit beta/citryl-CoA lyase [Neorhizobium huautlense]
MPPATDLSATLDGGAHALVVDLRESFDRVASLHAAVFSTAKAAYLPPVSSPEMAALLDICMTSRIATVFLSGARNGADLQHLDVLLQVSEARAGITTGTTRIVAMAGDNPHGLLAAASFAGKSKRLIGLGWDAGALASAMGMKSGLGSDVAASARATLLLAAAASGVAAIDTTEMEPDEEIFRAACLHVRAQGFSGKMTGTPSQVPVIQSVFTD